MDSKRYLQEKLTYTDDGRLLDERNQSVMMDWESDIMKLSAKVICENGGRVLNIGHGMGIVDSFIEENNIDEHWIIEAHSDVIQKIKNDGWYDKSHVNVIHSRWQDIIYDLPKFDGIYFDTWQDSEFYSKLVPYMRNLLKPNGIFSYFGNHTNLDYIKSLFEKYGMEVSCESMIIDNIPSRRIQYENGGYYWKEEWKDYNVLRIQNTHPHSINQSII